LSKEFPQSWYPIARSRDLRAGGQGIIKAFHGEWLLFRTASGQPGLTGRYCCHMGADLGRGQVQGEALECPLHGWRFTTSGRCIHIPGLPQPPADIALHSLVCRERYGVIFAFWGGRPAFELPTPPGMDEELVSSAVFTLDMEMEYHTPSLNTFDIQHFERIHNRRFVSKPDITLLGEFCLRIDYEAEILKKRWVDHVMAVVSSANTKVTIDCWGSSMLFLRNEKTGFGGLVTMLPVETGQSRVFIVALKQRRVGASLTGRVFDRIFVGLAAQLMRSFLHSDVRAITHMRPFRGYWIDGLDDGAQRYWDYWQQLPRWDGELAGIGKN